MYDDYYDTTTMQRARGGTWVCINGELYHTGVKGMKWGEHLPWTDWWKVGKNAYSNYMNTRGTSQLTKSTYTDANGRDRAVSKTTYTPPSKLKAFGYAGRAVASYANNQAKNAVGRSVSKYNESVLNKKYEHSRIGRYTATTHLESWAQTQYGKAYTASQDRNGWMDHINSFIQTAKLDVLLGVNNFLRKNGLTDKVDAFMSKILGNSSRTSQRQANQIAKNKRQDYSNADKVINDWNFIRETGAKQRQDNIAAERAALQNEANRRAAMRSQANRKRSVSR